MRDLHPMIQSLSENILRAWGEHFIVREVGIPEDFRKIDRADDDDAVYIENFVWETHHFRKIHLEIAQMKSGLDILHTNMYPRYEYSLPIFGADIVASSKNVGAAIVDISSIREDRSLPSQYDILNVVEDKEFEKDKKMPDWGDVFSEHCVFVSPNEDEYDKFNSIAFTFLNYHCAIANITEATTDEDQIRKNYEGHKYYCEKQRQNNKTKGVLKGIFGE